MRFNDELRKSGYDPIVSKICFDASSSSNAFAGCHLAMALQTCRRRVVGSHAELPKARREEAVPGICSSDSRRSERRRRQVHPEAMILETSQCSSFQEGTTANRVSRLHLRTAAESDLDKLAEYFALLSRSSRYNRFMEPVSN